MGAVITVYGRQQLLTALFAQDIVVLPDTLYVCYSRNVPPDNAAGSQLDEPATGFGYARVGIPLSSVYWAPSGFADVLNTTLATFPAPVGGDWGYLTSMALADSAVRGAGNLYVVAEMIEPFGVVDGDPAPVVDIGDLTVGLA